MMCSMIPCSCETETNFHEMGVRFDLTCSEQDGQDKIFLTINFHPYTTENKWLGDFGTTVKRCRLDLAIRGGDMPMHDRGLRVILGESVEKERKSSSSKSLAEVSTSESGTIAELRKEGFNIGIGEASSESKTSGESNSNTESFTFSDWQISAGGDDSNPSWTFEDKEKRGELRGGFNNKYLGLLRRKGTSCRIQAQIIAYRRDLVIRGESGVFPSDMESKNRKIAKQLAIFTLLGIGISPVRYHKCFEVQ